MNKATTDRFRARIKLLMNLEPRMNQKQREHLKSIYSLAIDIIQEND